jgi:hypothetical protein
MLMMPLFELFVLVRACYSSIANILVRSSVLTTRMILSKANARKKNMHRWQFSSSSVSSSELNSCCLLYPPHAMTRTEHSNLHQKQNYENGTIWDGDGDYAPDSCGYRSFDF